MTGHDLGARDSTPGWYRAIEETKVPSISPDWQASTTKDTKEHEGTDSYLPLRVPWCPSW